MPVCRGLVVPGYAEVGVFIGLASIGGNAIELNRAGLAGSNPVMMDGCAQAGDGRNIPAEVSGEGAVMIFIVRNRIVAVEAGEIREVVEPLVLAANRTFLMIGVKIAAIG